MFIYFIVFQVKFNRYLYLKDFLIPYKATWVKTIKNGEFSIFKINFGGENLHNLPENDFCVKIFIQMYNLVSYSILSTFNKKKIVKICPIFVGTHSRGHPKTTLTIFWPFLTIYLPLVDIFEGILLRLCSKIYPLLTIPLPPTYVVLST